MLRLPRKSPYSPKSNGWPNCNRRAFFSPEEFAAKKGELLSRSAFISDPLWPVSHCRFALIFSKAE